MLPSEAARAIGCDVSFVTKMIRSGDIQAVKVESDQNRYGYVYEVSSQEVERVIHTPPVKGWPRGKRRISNGEKKLKAIFRKSSRLSGKNQGKDSRLRGRGGKTQRAAG